MGYNFYSVSTNKGQLPSLQQLVLSLLDEKQKWNEEKGNAFTSETTKKKGGWEAERLQYVFGQRAPARACKGEGAISNGLLFRHIEKESDCDPGS